MGRSLVEAQLHSQNTAGKAVVYFQIVLHPTFPNKTVLIALLLYFLWHGTKYTEKTDVTSGVLSGIPLRRVDN